ncbi:MAG: hypothetical protein IKM77_07725 [Prevotella sp.]|nr:hypothetical protein [Prevotella sp.]
MKICYQKKKQVIYSEACPEETLRALAADQETKLLTNCCRLAKRYAEQEEPEAMPQWFATRFMKYCKDMTKEQGADFQNKTNAQKLQLFSAYEKGEHPFINFCASGYDESEIKDKKGNVKKGPWRKQKYVHLSGLVAIDIDHVENPMAIFERWQQELDFKALKIYFIYITPLGQGLRVVFRCDVSRGNLIDNQMWMCEKLGVEPDASCKDGSRGYFLTSDENFLYDNLKEMYDDEADEAFISKYEPEYRAGNSSSAKTGAKAAASARPIAELGGQMADCKVEELKWRGYEVQKIIDARYAEKLPCEADHNRHAESLKLATDLLLMLDRDPVLVRKVIVAQPWVQEIINARNENVEQTVESAFECVKKKEKEHEDPMPSRAMQAAVKVVTGKRYWEIVKGTNSSMLARKSQWPNEQLEAWGEEIEELFPYFPVLEDACAGLKRSQYPAALFVAGGVMMTLMTRTWYRFYHRPQQERRLNCSLFIIGHPASNKSMADDIYKILSAPMIAADKAGKAALNRYKKDTKKKAANKEGKDKPEALIRVHPARTSNGQLIQDMINAKEVIDGKEIQLHMFTFDTELDNATMLQKGGNWINKQAMELKAFHNEIDGQMYQNSDSPVDEFPVTWGFIYTGTPVALKNKVNERNFGSGLSTRLAVIPVPKTNFEMIGLEEQKDINWERLDRMKSWAYKLDARYGELPLWELVKQLYYWTENLMEDCAEDESEANELMLKRVPYHALNYSAPFIDMRHWDSLHQEGSYWTGTYETDETDWKLCELVARIQYGTQQHFFGALAEKYYDDMDNDVQFTGRRHYQKSIDGYSQLPNVFTKEDVIRVFGYKNEESARKKIYRLTKSHYIEMVEDNADTNKYRKLIQLAV